MTVVEFEDVGWECEERAKRPKTSAVSVSVRFRLRQPRRQNNHVNKSLPRIILIDAKVSSHKLFIRPLYLPKFETIHSYPYGTLKQT